MVDFVNKNKHSASSTEGEYIRLRLPRKQNKELFAIAERLLGGSRIHMICEDGRARLARIPGPWDIQNEKADILYRYSRTQSITLSKRRLLPEDLDVF